MAKMTIRLEIDRATRKRTVVISYESDADALPNEHEEEHRRLVNQLIEGGLVGAGDGIRVERAGAGEAAQTPQSPQSHEQQQAEGIKVKG
jgi:hypothetical protein